jgi:serine/threonine protein kinase
VVIAALTAGQPPSELDPSIVEEAESVAASADVWSLGMLLFCAAAGAPYWPRSFSRVDILHCLLGHSSMPHEANPHMLDAAGTLAPVVARMLSRSAEVRPSVLDVGEFAANGVTEAVMGLISTDVRSTLHACAAACCCMSAAACVLLHACCHAPLTMHVHCSQR